MCHFITATLPESADRTALDVLARKFGRQFQPMPSSALVAQLPARTSYFLTTLGHCDCGTVLGSARRAAARAPDWAVEEAKLLKKGWSTAKVARALAQRREQATLKATSESADRAQADNFERFVSGVLGSGLTPELGLLLHSYGGPLDEEFSILRHEHVPPNAALGDVLPDVEEDVLYVFRAGA